MDGNGEDEDIFWKIQLSCHEGDRTNNDSELKPSTTTATLAASSKSTTTWLAPQEREGINYSKGRFEYSPRSNDNEGDIYEWVGFRLNQFDDSDISTSNVYDNEHKVKHDGMNSGDNNDPILKHGSLDEPPDIYIRSIRSNVTLLDSHVGEEIWDAAKLFSVHLSLTTLKQIYEFSKQNDNDDKDTDVVIPIKNKRVLEMGAGCGLLGLVCYAFGASQVLCTDYLPEVMENLLFNLSHNKKGMDKFRDMVQIGLQETNNKAEDIDRDALKPWVKCGILDWNDYINDDLKDADWMLDRGLLHENLSWGNSPIHRGHECILQDASSFIPDVIIGSALVYSPQGGICCADVICKYLKMNEHFTTEVYILQMTERPGFDQFLLRIEYWKLSYEMYEISEKVYKTSKVAMPREAFKWIKIEYKKHLRPTSKQIES